MMCLYPLYTTFLFVYHFYPGHVRPAYVYCKMKGKAQAKTRGETIIIIICTKYLVTQAILWKAEQARVETPTPHNP